MSVRVGAYTLQICTLECKVASQENEYLIPARHQFQANQVSGCPVYPQQTHQIQAAAA
jgi:hypothetical protein